MKLHLTFGQRIAIGFISLIGMVIFTSGLGLWFSNTVVATGRLMTNSFDLYQQAYELENAARNISASMDRMILIRSTSGDSVGRDFESQIADFNMLLSDLELAVQEEDSFFFSLFADSTGNLKQLGESFAAETEAVFALAQEGQWDEAQVKRSTMEMRQRRFYSQVEVFRNQIEPIINPALDELTQLQSNLTLVLIIAAVTAVIGGSLLAYMIWRNTVLPVRQLIAQTEQVAQGKFPEIKPLDRADEIGQLSRSFADMTTWLRESYEGLERSVIERTHALETSMEISRSLTTILNQSQLVSEVVTQIKSAFNYYHVHIYVFDRTAGYLLMAGGTGDAGQALLAGGHKIAVGRGLVGLAAAKNQVVLVPDVMQDDHWLPNPLLPDTKSEVAVPIVLGNEMVGVLDVQHNVTNGISAMDADLLQSIANQVGVAIRNARLFEKANARAGREAIVNQISQSIQYAPDIESVLQIAARQIGESLGVERTAIQISMRSKDNGRSPQPDTPSFSTVVTEGQ